MRWIVRAIALAAILIAGLGAAASAQTAQDAAEWLKSLGIRFGGMAPIPEWVLVTPSVDFSTAVHRPAGAPATGPDDLAMLRAFPKLVDVRLGRPYATDEAVAALVKAVPRLQRLEVLWSASISDAAVADIAILSELVELKLHVSTITPAGMAHIARLSKLQSLGITGNDQGLAAIRNLPALRSLRVGGEGVTRDGMAAIAAMPELRILDIWGVRPDEAALDALARAPRLEHVILAVARTFDDSGGLHLGKLKNVRSLSLSGAAITDRSMPAIGSLATLQTLHLDRTAVTDAGLKALTALPNLTSITLNRTGITDAGMESLAQIKSLTSVNVANTDVGDDGERVLKAANPRIRVHRSPAIPGWTRDRMTGCRIWKGDVDPAIALTWSGPCVEGVAAGEGILEWWSSRRPHVPPILYARYEGRLLNGRRDGPGLYVTRYGFREQGEWRDDRFDSGTRFIAERYEAHDIEESIAGGAAFHGVLIQRAFADRLAGRYEGGWGEPRRVPDGQGTYVSSDGTILAGIWERGCLRVAGQHTRSLVTRPEDCGPMTLPAAFGKAPAVVQTDAEHWRDCEGEQLDFRIIGCTAVIAAGRESAARLAIAHNNRGFAYVAFRGPYVFNPRSRPAEALRDYDEAIRLNPSYADAYANRGALHISRDTSHREDRYAQSMQDLDEAIRLEPSHARAFHHRSIIHYARAQHDRAIQDLDEAIRLQPAYADAFRRRALSYKARDQIDRALEDLEQVTRLKPTDARAWLERCETRARIGPLDAALNDCDEMLRLKEASGADRRSAHEARGMVYFKAGRLDAAIADYDAALRSLDLPTTLYSRGLARQRNGDIAGGAADMAAAVAQSPNVAEWLAKHGVR